MAQNLVVNFIGNNKLDKTAAAATQSLRKFEKTAKNVSANVNRSLGAIGLGIGLATITNELKKATKAASDDRKSQGLLALALRNTVGATDQAIAGAEAYIKNTQLQTAVLDDELRPALATAVRATGSLAKGQALLDTALDVSAGTGKDLNTVTNAMSKAYNGNTSSLKKLLPSIKDGSDFMKQLDEQFKGAAESAANLDPYKRLEVIFADIQEQVGIALLPALEEFASYLASPVGQQNVQQLVDGFVKMGEAIVNASKFLIDNIDLVVALGAEVILVKGYFVATNVVVGLLETGIIKATTALKLMKIALVSTGLGAIAVALGSIAGWWLETAENTDAATEALDKYQGNQWWDSRIPKPVTGYDDYGPNSYEEVNARRLGYENYAEQLAAEREAKRKKDAAIAAAKEYAEKIKNALSSKIQEMKATAESFRDAVGLAFGVFGEDEYSVFNEQVFIDKLKRMVAAAKGFAGNIAKLKDQGADKSLVDELVGMGPAQGNIVAKGLLSGGNLKEILKLRGKLYGTGAQVGAEQVVAGNATYEININRAIISAADIVKEIRKLEKTTGRKYLLG